MSSAEINNYIKANQDKTREQLSEKLGLSKEAIRKRQEHLGIKYSLLAVSQKAKQAAEQPKKITGLPENFDELKELKGDLSEKTKLRKHLKEAMETIEVLEKEKEAAFAVKRTPEFFKIKKNTRGPKSTNAVAFMVASDWHVEEVVDPGTVNGMNEYNMRIAKERAEKFFANGLKLVETFQQGTNIKTLVIPMLGDFISNTIHDELAESNEVMPGDALWFAQSLLASGIKFLLENSDLDEIICVCHSGNHGRLTKKVHISTEGGNSLEKYMYRNLAEIFQDEPRVKFIIPDGMMSYMEVYDRRIRFIHGHSIKYGGGIGGVHIPVRKALAQWDKIKPADLTLMGHFHQMIDGGSYLVNGSLIGWNAFAEFVKADYQAPKQAFFLISDHDGGEKTAVCPIHLT